MNKMLLRGKVLCVVVTVLVAGVTPYANASPARPSPAGDWTVEDLSWMAGCWQHSTKDQAVQESWLKPAGGAMQGHARVISQGKTVFREFVYIEKTLEGIIMNVVLPKVAPKAPTTTPFKLIRLEKQQAIFENPEHDFPTRIIYRKERDGSLFARIEGLQDGKAVSEDFPYKRTRCD